MRRWFVTLFIVLGCGLGAGALAQGRPVIIGSVISQSGLHAAAAQSYRRGLELWQQQVNGRGGMLGRMVELRILDDRSEAVETGPLYQRLIREENADVLFGPYGSAASAVGAAVAERARRVMLNASGAAKVVHKAGHIYVFQLPAPYEARGEGVLALARAAGHRSMLILTRADTASREVAQGLAERAREAGFAVPDVQAVAAGQQEFGELIALAKKQRIDAWAAFMPVRETADLIRAFRKFDYAPQLLFAEGASDPALIKQVGQDAEFTLSLLAWDPRWTTPGNADFVTAYRSRWGVLPTLDAAQAYSAGLVLEEAARRSGTLESAALRRALAELEFDTPAGRFKVDPRTGIQLGMRPYVTQIQRGRPQVVWPADQAAGRSALPYPQWRDRRPIQ